ncbi:IMP dehydrogenase [Dictyobacter kobayashii]|uniref:IMP dehydrogenase n=1 Tax=Dictyobacter kobayashii TaxID=2014872 RepID=A0A402AYA8_9CHLR|nr:zinc-dependent alcohol dehydrogenase family protein [Dictyobacter kobayashii]GCE24096.1 IMP dehydrogenase [Dictyobacter kobayashii]
MRATVYHNKFDVRIDQVPDPQIKEPTDAIIRVTHACICGSDLWPYRGLDQYQEGWRLGHEFMGIVEEVGKEVKTVKKGDRVISPFTFSDGSCEFCHKGLYTSCIHGGFWGGANNDGGQAEAMRVPLADGTLVVVPPETSNDEKLLKSILPLTDVMGTGHHAAVAAGVRQGSTAAIVGDGAVGLCGVLAAKRLGASRIIMLGHQPERLKIAKEFGATDIVEARGDDAVKQVQEMTKGGADATLECVGTKAAMDMAIDITRPGGGVGYVGAPHGSEQLNFSRLFLHNISMRGGIAPVRAYLPVLLKDVLAGKLDPAPVLNMTVDLEGYLLAMLLWISARPSR